MKTSTFAGAFAGAFDCARLADVNNNPALDGDWARKKALVNGARSIFHCETRKID
jgi:hypothetical protein